MNDSEIKNLMLLYALGDLNGPASDEIRARLNDGCPVCTAALKEAQATLGLIPMSLPSTPPPPALKDKVMSAVARERPSRVVTRERLSQLADAGSPTIAMPRVRPARQLNWTASAWRALPWAAAIILALLWSQSRAITAQAQRTLTARDTAISELNAELTQAKNRHSTAFAALAQQLDDTRASLDVLRAQQMRLVSLETKDATQGSARIFWDQEQHRWLLLAKGFAALPAGRVYEVWFITAEQKKVAAGLLAIDASGDGHLRLDVPQDLGALALAAITDEPGLVQEPTGSVQFSGKL